MSKALKSQSMTMKYDQLVDVLSAHLYAIGMVNQNITILDIDLPFAPKAINSSGNFKFNIVTKKEGRRHAKTK